MSLSKGLCDKSCLSLSFLFPERSTWRRRRGLLAAAMSSLREEPRPGILALVPPLTHHTTLATSTQALVFASLSGTQNNILSSDGMALQSLDHIFCPSTPSPSL